MMRIISKLLFWKRRAKVTTDGGGRILIIAPDYDDLTNSLANWVSEFSSLNAVTLKGRNASHDNAGLALNAMGVQGLIIIFAGHGDAAALLTDPKLGRKAELYRAQHSILVDSDMVSSTLGLGVFAYACESAKDLGEVVASRNGIFIGYKEQIPFVRALKGGIDPLFKLPLAAVWKSISSRELLGGDTLDVLLKVYADQIEALKQGDHRKNRHASLVRMAMRQHRKHLTMRGGVDVSDVN